MGRIAVTGSVAFDTIMVFPGRFGDHILPDKTHLINVSFQVDTLERRSGGTAANVCYSMALLGDRPLLCAAVGAGDFDAYEAELEASGVDTSAALRSADVPTAAAFITTDLDDNQITAFFAGAMARAAGVDLTALDGVSDVVVGADAADAMAAHIAQAAALRARLTFAPAQQIPSLSVGRRPPLADHGCRDQGRGRQPAAQPGRRCDRASGAGPGGRRPDGSRRRLSGRPADRAARRCAARRRGADGRSARSLRRGGAWAAGSQVHT
ncbi:MAG: hypothetical protein E6J45_09895 [Chloroflexi bacterium]|nr:MAG: hypothetical protein E6J45_09895 [Chloroflexota bacterium]